MKTKHFVTLFFVAGLIFAITGLVGPAMAQDQINNNPNANLNEDSEVIQDTFTTEQPAEAGPAAIGPSEPSAERSFVNATCNASPLVVPAAAFSGDGDAEGSYYFLFSEGYIYGNSQNYGCVKAPVYPPHGATVTSVWATVRDNNASDNIELRLRRVNILTGVMDTMATLTTSGASTNIQQISDTSVSEGVIDNTLYFYYLVDCLWENQYLWGARIHTANINIMP